MQLLSMIRRLRILAPRENEKQTVVRIEVRRGPWRSSEELTAGECVTVGMVLLAQGATTQKAGSLAHSYTLSALTNLREELDEQIARANAVAKLIAESK